MPVREIAVRYNVSCSIFGESTEDIFGKLNCHRSFLSSQEEKIRQLYEQGISGTETAEPADVSCPFLYEFIHRKKFEKRPLRCRSVFDGHDEELTPRRKDETTLGQIGEYFGVAKNTIWHRMQKLQS